MMYDIWKLGKFHLNEMGIGVKEAVLETPEFDYILSIKMGVPQSNAGSEDNLIDGISHSLESWQYETSMVKQFPYHKPPARGSGVLPTAKLNISDPSKTLPGKIRLWFEKLEEQGDEYFDDLFKKTRLYLDIHEEMLVKELKEEATSLKKSYKLETGRSNPRIMLTVTYDDEAVQNRFNTYLLNHSYPEATRKFADTHGTISEGMGACFYCNQEKMVNGFASPFVFYTHDKGTFAPELSKERAYQQFPVCNSCGVIANSGGKFVEENLKYRFYGVNYFLIPQFVNENDIDDLLYSIQEKYSDSAKNVKTKQVRISEGKNLTDDENEILEDLSEFENVITLTFLFYQINQAQMEILGVIPDILPSRLSTLFKAKRKIEERKFLRNWGIAVLLDPIQFNYEYFRKLYPKNHPGEQSSDDKYLREFLQLALSSIQGNKIHPREIIQATNRMTQAYFANRSSLSMFNTFQISLVGLMVYEYLYLIGCLKLEGLHNGEHNKMTSTSNTILEKLDISDSKLAQNVVQVFEENKYYDHPMKKGAFIMGILVKEVTRQQYKSLKSEPFYEVVNGLRMDARVVKRLLPEIVNKLIEYDANKKQIKSLQTLIGYYFGNFDNTGISKDDLSFAFTLGISMGQAIWKMDTTEQASEVQ